MRAMPPRVSIVEVGPRDGLQNESVVISTADKVAFVDRLSAAGHSRIEVSAFVSPKRVPQLADAAEVFAGITRREGVRYDTVGATIASPVLRQDTVGEAFASPVLRHDPVGARHCLAPPAQVR